MGGSRNEAAEGIRSSRFALNEMLRVFLPPRDVGKLHMLEGCVSSVEVLQNSACFSLRAEDRKKRKPPLNFLQ